MPVFQENDLRARRIRKIRRTANRLISRGRQSKKQSLVEQELADYNAGSTEGDHENAFVPLLHRLLRSLQIWGINIQAIFSMP